MLSLLPIINPMEPMTAIWAYENTSIFYAVKSNVYFPLSSEVELHIAVHAFVITSRF